MLAFASRVNLLTLRRGPIYGRTIENLSAYDRYLRGLASIHRWTRDGNDEGLEHFKKAIELEPGLAAAYGLAAWCYVRRKALGWMTDPISESGEAMRFARRGVLIGKDDPVALVRSQGNFPATGEILWQFGAGSSVNAGPAIVDGTLYWGAGYARSGIEGSGNQQFFAFSLGEE